MNIVAKFRLQRAAREALETYKDAPNDAPTLVNVFIDEGLIKPAWYWCVSYAHAERRPKRGPRVLNHFEMVSGHVNTERSAIERAELVRKIFEAAIPEVTEALEPKHQLQAK